MRLNGRVEAKLRRLIRALDLLLAGALVVLVVMLAVYLAGSDQAFTDGRSRWSHRIGEPENTALVASAVVLLVAAGATLLAGSRSGRLRHAVAGALLGVLGVVATTLTFIAFTAS